jgi:hypothetical protein
MKRKQEDQRHQRAPLFTETKKTASRFAGANVDFSVFAPPSSEQQTAKTCL